jgi:predicted DCC family thiol-disulfide oxidoreductase YuxK
MLKPAEGRPTKPRLFYDGECPLCRREVAHYRRLDRVGRVEWIDITREPEVLAEQGIDSMTAMQRLHAIDEHGRVVSGVAAFVTVWRHLPGFRHLAWLVGRLALTPLLERIYSRFAAWRFRRRCAAGVCQTRPPERSSGNRHG